MKFKYDKDSLKENLSIEEIFDLVSELGGEPIMGNDSDGYIRGNTAIQEILGYKSQFTNQEEFDDLMDSDIAFKL